MTREKSKVAATRHAKHEWPLKRKALAVTLSIALLGLGTPAVSFADSAADNAAAPASKENASGAVSKDEMPAPASSDDQPSDKASASTEAASKDVAPASEAKHEESNGGYYVYLYTKVVGNTKGLTLEVNGNGWYTIGRVWVEGISNPAQGSSTSYVTSGDDYNKVISALKDPGNVNLYGVNSINLEDIEWSVKGQSTGLKMASGAVDYDNSNNPTWHLDGYVDLDKVGFGSIKFHYKDVKTKDTISEDKTVTAKVTGEKFDISSYKISIKGYTYAKADPDPSSVVVERGVTKEVTLYYTAKQGKVGYYLADSSATWDAPANTVRTENLKWYYNYGFAKGDTVQVTDAKPTAAGKVFIGWLDKERGDQLAAIREAGDTVAYIYDGAKTYTLDALWASLDVTGYKDTYDGKEHGLASVDVAINKGSDLAQQYQDQAKDFIKQGTVQYSIDGGTTWSETAPKCKDVGTYPVKVKVDVTVDGKPSTLEASANIVITPATLTVSTDDAERAYNGQPLTAGGSVEGFVNGESAPFKTTGSRIEVGWSNNTYAIDWEAADATAKQSNYTVSEKLGILEVTAAPDSPTPDDQSKDQGIFNGNGANSGLVQTGDTTGIYGMAAIVSAVVAAFVSLLAVRRRKE